MNEKQKTKGYVNWSGSRDFRGRISWSFRLKNEEKWFGCGPVDPKVKKGDLIEFEYEESNGYYNVIVDSIHLIDLGATTPRTFASSGNTGRTGSAQSKDGYWDERLSRDIENDKHRKANEVKIQFQAARNAAIATVDILTREKALIIPEKKGAASEVIMAKIKDLTNEYFQSTSAVGEPASETQQEDREET